MPEDCTKDPVKSNGTEVKNSQEPSELDPCMEETKVNGRSEFFHRYRDEVCAKSGLSHKGLYVVSGIVIAACLLLIVVIALSVAWPRIPHRFQFPVCQDAECLRAAAQIREGLNNLVSPCEDLWSSTCGGWLKKYPLPEDRSIWNQKQQLVRRDAERVRDLIATLRLPLHTGTVEWKLKHLYEACLDVDNVNSDGDRPLIDIITELVLHCCSILQFISALVAVVYARPEPPVGYSYATPTAIPSAHYSPAPAGGSLGGGLSLGFGGSAGGVDIGHGGFSSGGIGLAQGGFSSGGADLGHGGFSSGSAGFSSGSAGFSSGGSGGFGGGGGVVSAGPALVHKHVYVHVAPEEPEEPRAHRPIHVAAPQKHYKIIFIKAPSAPAPTAPIIPVQPQNEEKTLVYVLVKKPEEQPDIEIPTPAPTQPSKPEVYFIRYRTQQAAVSGGAGAGAGAGFGGSLGDGSLGGGASIEGGSIGGGSIGGGSIGGGSFGGHGAEGGADIGDGSIGGGISSGHSGSIAISGSSAGVSSKYGPPGYQH